MMRTVRTGILPALLTLCGSAALAQEPKPQYFVLHQELAKPSKIGDYEATSKEFVALVKKHKALMPHFSIDGFASPDFAYTFVAPLKSMADLDAITAEFGALAQAAQEQVARFFLADGVTVWNPDHAEPPPFSEAVFEVPAVATTGPSSSFAVEEPQS